ncbi:hypothetical protein [Bremerella cremea]|uniref:hypothetical protein n=1 Tax=Bremerella cremea TaxID=1031537 RepID=UPI0031E6B1F0
MSRFPARSIDSQGTDRLSSSTRTVAANASPNSIMTRVFVVVLIGLVILFVAFLVILSTSSHSGQQFSADGFERRKFSYFEILGYRLTATEYFNNTGNLENDLVKQKWITSSGKAKKTDWVTVSHTMHGHTYVSDANILVSYLDMSQPNSVINLARWSRSNPGYASLMWSEIQKMAEGNMYLLVPDIIHHTVSLSQQDDNPIKQPTLKEDESGYDEPISDLSNEAKAEATRKQEEIGKASLDPFLIELYLKAGKAAQDAQEDARARFCFEQVLRLSPESAEAKSALDQLPPAPEKDEAETPEPAAEVSSEEETNL